MKFINPGGISLTCSYNNFISQSYLKLGDTYSLNSMVLTEYGLNDIGDKIQQCFPNAY